MRKAIAGDEWVTFVEVDEVELDPCTVNYESSPAEPDVNWGGDLYVLSVIHNGLDIYPQMGARDREYLHDRLSDYLLDSDDDGYGDYLYQQRKDERGMA